MILNLCNCAFDIQRRTTLKRSCSLKKYTDLSINRGRENDRDSNVFKEDNTSTKFLLHDSEQNAESSSPGSATFPSHNKCVLLLYSSTGCGGGSVSTAGGTLLSNAGLTNTPWPEAQRKYTRPCTVPLCLPAREKTHMLQTC